MIHRPARGFACPLAATLAASGGKEKLGALIRASNFGYDFLVLAWAADGSGASYCFKGSMATIAALRWWFLGART